MTEPRFLVSWRRWLPVLLVLLAALMPLFWLLASHPVQQYDEARTGINGLGILRTGDWLVLRDSELQPERWNLKPPLWPWLLAVSFRVLGPGELGLRLPAALAGLATVLVVYEAGRRWLGSWESGLLAALILLTTPGYVGTHVTRSGDYDALLTLWTTLGALSWLRFLATGHRRAVWLTGGFFLLAVFTKGVAGLLFGPGLLVAALVTGQGRRLRQPALWGALLGVLAGASLWYGIREAAGPGYLAAVWQNEIGGRATEQLEGHLHESYWYVVRLMEYKFTFWVVAAALGGLLGWQLPRGSRGWYLARGSGSLVGVFMLLLAFTQTKLYWYDAPIYPLLALLAAGGLSWTARALAAQQHWHPGPTARLATVVLVVALPYWAECRTLSSVYNARHDTASLLFGRHVRQQVLAAPELRDYLFGTDGQFNDAPVFQRVVLEMRYGHRIRSVLPWEAAGAAPGATVVVCGAAPRRTWESLFRTSVLLTTDSCVTLRLEARR